MWLPPELRGQSRLTYVNRGFCERELPQLERFVQPGGTAIDVGAHYGIYTLALSPLVGNEGRVLALEPEPEA